LQQNGINFHRLLRLERKVDNFLWLLWPKKVDKFSTTFEAWKKSRCTTFFVAE
jgi:hypothetical protein